MNWSPRTGGILVILYFLLVFASPALAQEETDTPDDSMSVDTWDEGSSRFEDGQDEDDRHGTVSNESHARIKVLGLGEKSETTGKNQGTYLFRFSIQDTLSFNDSIFMHANARLTGIHTEAGTSELDGAESEWGSGSSFESAHTGKTIMDGNLDRVLLDLREAWIKLEKESFSLKAGRQRINWGEGRFFDPLNVVSPMDASSLEQDELRGTDSVHGIFWVGDNTRLESVLTFNRIRNEMRSDFEKTRTYRIPSYLENPWSPSAWSEYEERKWFSLDTEQEELLGLAGFSDRYRDGSRPELYQDLAFRLRGPLTDTMDGSAVVGWKGRRAYAGLDWNGAFEGAAFRAGAIYFSPMTLDPHATNRIAGVTGVTGNDNKGYGQLYAGMDYTFSRYLTVAAQYFYNGGALIYRPGTALYLSNLSNPLEDRDGYDLVRTGVFTIQPHYLNLSLTGDITDLVGYETYLFGDINGKGAMSILAINANITDSLLLTMGIRYYSPSTAYSDFNGQDSGVYFIADYSLF